MIWYDMIWAWLHELSVWHYTAHTDVWSVRKLSYANCSHPSCLCSPSSEIGSSPLKGCGDNCGPGGKYWQPTAGLWLTSPAGWLPRTGISSGNLRSVIEHGLPFSRVAWQKRLYKCPATYFLFFLGTLTTRLVPASGSCCTGASAALSVFVRV